MTGSRLLKPEEVAEYLGVSRRAVMNWLRAGRIRGVKVGRFWRVRPEDLEAFLEKSSEHDEEPLTKEDFEAIQQALEDIKAGRCITLEEYEQGKRL